MDNVAMGQVLRNWTFDEIFFDKKCGVNANPGDSTHDAFFSWCSNPTYEPITTNCIGVGGIAGYCDGKLQFESGAPKGKRNIDELKKKDYSDLDRFARQANKTIPTTGGTTISPNPTSVSVNLTTPGGSQIIPTKVTFKQICGFGPGKRTVNTQTLDVRRDQVEKLKAYCYQEIYGPPEGMPLWLLILIVLLVILVVSVAFAIFWRYWLKRRIYGRDPNEPMSTIESHWTASPLSSSSALSSTSIGSVGSDRGKPRALASGLQRSGVQSMNNMGSRARSNSLSKTREPGGLSSNYRAGQPSQRASLNSASRTKSDYRPTSQLRSTHRSDRMSRPPSQSK